MNLNDLTATLVTTVELELRAIGDAIFAEWYPYHRPGDPVPPLPPLHIAQEAQALAQRHERCRRLGIGIYGRATTEAA